jgi:hypothetical protein
MDHLADEPHPTAVDEQIASQLLGNGEVCQRELLISVLDPFSIERSLNFRV